MRMWSYEVHGQFRAWMLQWGEAQARKLIPRQSLARRFIICPMLGPCCVETVQAGNLRCSTCHEGASQQLQGMGFRVLCR